MADFLDQRITAERLSESGVLGAGDHHPDLARQVRRDHATSRGHDRERVVARQSVVLVERVGVQQRVIAGQRIARSIIGECV